MLIQRLHKKLNRTARHGYYRATSLLLVLAILAANFPLPPASVNATINDLTQLDYRLYQNTDAVQPTTALAAENTAVTGPTQGAVYRIRVNLNNSGTRIDAATAVFKLQYSTSTSGPWSDVGAIGSGVTWRGYDNATPADGANLTAALLASSTNNDRQTYEEANNATNSGRINKNKPAEFDWVVQDNAATAGTAYYFRMVQSSGTALAGYTNYPQITPGTPSVTVTQSGGSTDVTEGGATDTYTLVLDAEPSATVTITLTTGGQATASPSVLTFTTGNWSSAQTVTVTAVNDVVVEGADTDTITHSASGGGYSGVSISNVVANITDNDTASVTVTESGGSTDITEGGASDTYTVVLDLEPSGTVTITITTGGQATATPSVLTFTTGNWNIAQTVTADAVNDLIVEGSDTDTFSHSASGGGYTGVSISNVVANITDNDSASVTVSESGGSTDVIEGGANDTYTVVLDLEPSGTVTITLTTGGQVTASPPVLTFTNGDWNSAQTVTVTAVNDAAVEGAHTGDVTHSASGGSYDFVAISDVVPNITDDDIPGVTVTESGGSTDITEGGAGDTYTVVLDTQPSGTVTITITTGGQVTATPSVLTFTTGNWSSAQTVTVTAANDAVVEGAHTGDVHHSASGGSYSGVSISDVDPNITDNDTASVTVIESSGSTDVIEGGANDTYTVVLDLEPSGTVTITLTTGGQVTASPSVLTFTTGNWSAAQTVTVTAVNDVVVEGPHSGDVSHSASGGSYTGVSISSVAPNITDNDTASVTVTESGGSTTVTEGGAVDTYTVVLDLQPSGTVTITITTGGQVNASPSVLTFTTGDWNSAQTVTADAVNDVIVEGADTGDISHSASGGSYDGASIASVAPSITDNDVASVTVTESGGTTDVFEAGTGDSYDVVLDAQPSGTVTVTITTGGQVNVSPSVLTFTTGDFSTPQTVTVSAVDDVVVEGAHSGDISHTASGGAYDGVSIADVDPNITDNDAGASVTVTESSGSTDVTEVGTADTYDVVLGFLPTGDVTITITTGGQVNVSPSVLTFTTGDFSTPQTVTVTAVNDIVVEGAHTDTITHSPSGGGYTGVFVDDVVPNITDNDPASVTVTESGGSTDVTEGGTGDTYTIVLDAEPSSTVTITLSTGGQVNVSPSVVTFTTGDYSSPQIVTVTAVNDAVVEGADTDTITHSASGGGYSGVSVSNVVPNITDNDTASVTVTESSGSTDVVEGGANDNYTVVLDLEPSNTVTITLTTGGQVTVSPSVLTFTTENWNSAQTVTVTSVDDAVVEGQHSGDISHSASGGSYDGVSIASVAPNITDNDTATVTVTESGGSTDVFEVGTGDTYDVVLDLEPSGTVTITITTGGQVTASPSVLTFTTGDWSTPQTVTVTAVNDAVVEGPHSGDISHSASGGSYGGVSISDVLPNITDNDTASVNVTESGGSTDITEGGTGDTYTVVLDLEPSATVTITITTGGQVTASPSVLTFTTGDWNSAQTVTVTAVNDAVVEGAHSGDISHSASGGSYDGVSIADVDPNITDNDTASVTVTESSGATDVIEGGATDTYTVVLDLEPSATVTITLTTGGQVSASPSVLTFTTGNWSSAQTVTVTAVNDVIVEGAHSGDVTHSASGGSYDGVSIADVDPNITDNDTASVTVTESGGATNVAEGGSTDTYTVVLDAEPSATVTITFTTGDWNTAQQVTADAVNDLIVEGAHTGDISHSAIGGGYNGVSIAVVAPSVIDNEIASVTVTESGGSTDVIEGGASDTYTVVLDLEPSATVTVTITTGGQVSASPSVLTFTTGDWNTPQTVTADAVNDAVVEGAHSGDISHSSTGGSYNGVSIASVAPDITDDDTASVTVTESGGSTDVVEAGATDNYTVVLDLEPSGTVTITLTTGGQVSASPSVLIFTTGDWSSAQTVTVTAIDDPTVEGPHIGDISHSASGGSYGGVSISNVVPNISDNDSELLVQNDYRWYQNINALQPTTALAAENTAITGPTQGAVYRIRMNLDNTGVTLAAGAVFKLQYSTSTSGPWSDLGAIGSGDTWRGYDNPSVTDGLTISAALLSSSFNNDRETYEEANNATTVDNIVGGKEAEFDWVVQDNAAVGGTTYYFRMVYSGGSAFNTYTNYPQVTPAVPSVTVAESGGSTDVTEVGTADTYTVVLDAEPSSTVTITITTGGQVDTTPSVLTFTTTDWNIAQTVTVDAVNDAVVEAPHSGDISHSASGGGYTGVSIADVLPNITDNDPPSVTVTESSGSTDVTEGGAVDTYTVVLDLEPSGTVTITLSTGGQVNVSPSVLTFTTGDWNNAQTVTADAANDVIVEGAHTGDISHSASGGSYDGVSISNVVPNITDNDPTVTITESGRQT